MEDLLTKKMGERIRFARQKMELTQAELAEKIGVSVSFLGHVERGTRKVSIETLVALSEVLDMSLDVMVKGTLREESVYNRALSRQNLISEFVQFLEERDQKQGAGREVRNPDDENLLL